MMSYMVAFVVTALLATVSVTNAQSIVNYGRCVTPAGDRALCIHLEQCGFLYNLLQKKPLLDEDRQFLSRSQCGSTNGKILICCADKYIQPSNPVSTDSRIAGSLPEPGTCGTVFSDKIYGGNVTNIDEYPWMVLIEYQKGQDAVGHHCGGSLINERYVLTAAHCISAIPETWRPFRVRLGEWDTSTDRDCQKDLRGREDCADPHIDITIERAIVHEKYVAASKNQLYDIALLRLSRKVAYTDFIKPICLPVNENLKRASFEGVVMDVAGWGKTETGSTSEKKLKAGVAVVPRADCERTYRQRSVQISDSQICAGGQAGIDSCRGDSGGPLIGLDTSNKLRAYYFLAGVVSFGPTPCGLPGWPGVYTKVSDYVNWVKENIQA